jgi:hypothetical protein
MENARHAPMQEDGWANISGAYLRDLDDFAEMCRECHMDLDFEIGVTDLLPQPFLVARWLWNSKQ